MDSFLTGLATACWLGILTSISPCPLATNIAAVSYVGRRVDRTYLVLLSGGLYVLGRMIAYSFLGIIIVAGLLSISNLSFMLQDYANLVLGPLLIIVGIFLVGIIRPNLAGPGISDRIRKKAESYGLWGALLLGFIFALSFCPISAALFFGSLIPLSTKFRSFIVMPSIYGVGTGLPVFVFALLIAFGANFIGGFFDRVAQIALWARRLTGLIFIIIGFYYSLIYIFKLDL